jgi:hypothetical protein
VSPSQAISTAIRLTPETWKRDIKTEKFSYVSRDPRAASNMLESIQALTASSARETRLTIGNELRRFHKAENSRATAPYSARGHISTF